MSATALTPARAFIERAVGNTLWDHGNRVLYTLCAMEPEHLRADVVLSKVWLIGRSYAASIERRPDASDTVAGDDFYEKVVAPAILRSRIDDWFQRLRRANLGDNAVSMEVYLDVLALFKRIAGIEKRSLVSKYLHFHFPERYFIYDSRAMAAIRRLEPSVRRVPAEIRRYDGPYTHFHLRASRLRARLSEASDRSLSTRDLDKVLLAWHRRGVTETLSQRRHPHR